MLKEFKCSTIPVVFMYCTVFINERKFEIEGGGGADFNNGGTRATPKSQTKTMYGSSAAGDPTKG